MDYEKQLAMKDLKIKSLEKIIFSYKKEKIVNLKRIERLSKLSNVDLNIDDQSKIRIMIDGKFEIKLEQNYLSDNVGYCYLCLTDDVLLQKFSCSHGVCNECFIKSINNKFYYDKIMNKCFVCNKDIKNIIRLN